MRTDAAFWDGIAEKYAAKPVDDPDAFERKIAHTRGLLRPDAVVLEVGSGTGSLALRLADACDHIHGLDLSAEMVRIARAKASAAQASNVAFHVGPFDASFTELDPASVDVLCAFSVLHLVPDLDAALARAFTLTRPGGEPRVVDRMSG
jgi:arsenite methyltransferase